jgi:hypothetical protein
METGMRTALRLMAAVGLMLTLVPAGAAAARRPTHVTVVLEPRSPVGLRAYAEAVSMPSSPLYRHYLTPAQFARRFGASSAAIARVRGALRAQGLRPGAVSANHLSIRAVPATGVVRRPLAEFGRLTASALPGVQAIEGLHPAPGPHPLLVRGTRRRPRASQPHAVTGGPQPCAAARTAAASSGAYTDDQIASAYGLSGSYRSGDFGAGITVAVYELEPVAASDLAAFQACYGINVPIDYVRVDGGAGSGEGSGESALDIENVLGYVPGARVLVYQGPNSNFGGPGSGPYDVFNEIVSQDRAQVVTISWGECESALGPTSAQAENTLFQEAAAQGQTIVAAGGDTGAEDCQTASSAPAPQPAVDDPASQPFVTGVGGTTLSSLGPRPAEEVWNNGGTPAALLSPGAGGGGISALWGMPAAQLDALPGLNVRSGAPTGSTCGQPGGWCRQVPDVSADADPATGYEIYYNGLGTAPGQPRGWQAFGGTSAASPVWASLMALADASPGCAGAPVGMGLPALYRAAGSNYAGAFNDVRSGNNDFTGTNSGRFAAGPGYDEASGLGSPNGPTLIPQLCASALRLPPLPAQRSARLARISTLRVPYSDVPHAGLVLHVRGLPPGLRFSPATARIRGTPRRSGRYRITVTASDRDGGVAREIVTWTIGNPMRLESVTVRGLSAGRPVVSFTVAAGRGSPPLRRLIVAVPGGLRLRSTRSITAKAAGRRVRFSTRLGGGHLTLTLRAATSGVQVALGPRAVRTGSARASLSGQLSVTAVDSAGATRLLRAAVARR